MSILFYSKPEFVRKEANLSQSSCQRYVERAARSRAAIPPELSFENVIEGRSLPPCTLQDFLDYLTYISHDAENLQFFLWLKNYIARFESLPVDKSALSEPRSEYSSYPTTKKGSTEASTARSFHVCEIMKPLPKEPIISGLPPDLTVDSRPPSPTDSDVWILESLTRVSTEATLRPVEYFPAPPSAEIISAQPFREEVDRIAAHYLTAGAPRELNLSARDRKNVLRALAHTTHPPALATVGHICEQTLKYHSHRNFVRWSICNGNKPRVLVLRTLAIFVITSCIAVCAFLILSKHLRWYRLAVIPFFYFGAVNLIAARQGLCVLLHRRHTRERRPWELNEDVDPRENAGTVNDATPWDNEDATDGGESGNGGKRKASRRQQRLAALGPRNDYQSESWVRNWEYRSPWRKIRVQKVKIASNGGLRMIQDRIIWQAEAWGLLVTVLVVVAVCAFPEFALF